MTTTIQSDFFLLRYVPDTVKDEFINIGVVVRSPQGVEVRFTKDYSRVFSLDPDVDVEWLASLEQDLRRILGSATEQNAALFKKLGESFSNTIQFSPVKGLETENPTVEANKLAKIYLETSHALKSPRNMRVSARQRLCAKMTDIFVEAGIWDAMTKDIAANQYTHPGDPFKFDCGYGYTLSRKKVKLYHAVALGSGTDPAKSLGYTWPGVREGIMREEGAVATLTAVIDDGFDAIDDRIAFSLSTFARSGIKVAPLAELPQYAEQARRELGL